MWLERKPFGLPNDWLPRVDLSDKTSKGYRHAALRNELINHQQLPWNHVYGNMDEWSWWKSLPKDTPQSLTDAIEAGLGACCTMAMDPGTVLGDHYRDPVSAIAGLMTDLREFLAADLKSIRSHGILLAHAPVTIVDPDLEHRSDYNTNVALCFAMKIAPAVCVDLHGDTEYTQLCIPVLTGSGLDELGHSIAEEGERMLRAFVLVVLAVYNMFKDEELVPFARTHKAESVEILGERWFSKACASDREAVGLLDPQIKGGKSTRLYCYLGGGGLTEASTSLAQGVVCKAKTWKLAVAVCIAVRVLTGCVPGPTVELEEAFCTQDDEELVPDLDDEVERRASSEPRLAVKDFCNLYNQHMARVWIFFGLIPEVQLSLVPTAKTVERAREALQGLRSPSSRINGLDWYEKMMSQ